VTRHYFLLIFLIFVFSLASFSASATTAAFERWTFDNTQLSKSEDMGLLGWNYSIEYETLPLYTGLGIYSAVTGDRGGFFVGGFEFGLRLPVYQKLLFDAGYYAGGGGGGAAPQGGGLMLRPHLSLLYTVHTGQHIGLGYSQVSFPNGDIYSGQLSFQYEHDFNLWIKPGWFFTQKSFVLPSDSSNRFADRQFGVHYTHYLLPPLHQGRSGKILSRMDVVGVRARTRFNSSAWWFEFDTGGAFAGGVDGYAQVLAGLSRRFNLSQSAGLHIGLMPGASGGGDVDTGGGALYRAFAGLDIPLWFNTSLLLDAGYIQALDGEFNAWMLNSGLVLNYSAYSSSSTGVRNFSKAYWQEISLRAGVQRYVLKGDLGRKSTRYTDIPVDLVTLKLEYQINPHVFLTGQALGAYDGGAGGYAVGFLGGGLWTPGLGRANLRAGTEVTAGAAGGGGLDVGGGILFQAMLNFAADITQSTGLYISAGRVVAPEGGMNSPVLEAGLQFRLGVPRALASE